MVFEDNTRGRQNSKMADEISRKNNNPRDKTHVTKHNGFKIVKSLNNIILLCF